MQNSLPEKSAQLAAVRLHQFLRDLKVHIFHGLTISLTLLWMQIVILWKSAFLAIRPSVPFARWQHGMPASNCHLRRLMQIIDNSNVTGVIFGSNLIQVSFYFLQGGGHEGIGRVWTSHVAASKVTPELCKKTVRNFGLTPGTRMHWSISTTKL